MVHRSILCLTPEYRTCPVLSAPVLSARFIRPQNSLRCFIPRRKIVESMDEDVSIEVNAMAGDLGYPSHASRSLRMNASASSPDA